MTTATPATPVAMTTAAVATIITMVVAIKTTTAVVMPVPIVTETAAMWIPTATADIHTTPMAMGTLMAMAPVMPATTWVLTPRMTTTTTATTEMQPEAMTAMLPEARAKSGRTETENRNVRPRTKVRWVTSFTADPEQPGSSSSWWSGSSLPSSDQLWSPSERLDGGRWFETHWMTWPGLSWAILKVFLRIGEKIVCELFLSFVGRFAGRGGSLMVSALPLYSNDLSSNPAGYLICRKDENEWKRRLGLAHL